MIEKKPTCGVRHSYPRELVLEVLRNCKDHPTANTVYERAREIKPDISRGTVYRNLKLLGESSEILTLETKDDFIHYDGDTSPHSHFICLECGGITDLFTKVTAPRELTDMDYEVTEIKNIYYGYCNKCKK